MKCNSRLSDHYIVKLGINYEEEQKKKTTSKPNDFYISNLNQYDFFNASEELWPKFQPSHHRHRRDTQEFEAIRKIKKNPKYFYSYAKRFYKVKSIVGPFIDEEGAVVDDSFEMSEMLDSNTKKHSVILPKKPQ